VLALFCGMATAELGPKNLTVGIGDSKGDFVNLELSWEAGSCFVDNNEIYIEGPNGTLIYEDSTTDSTFTLEDMEYWTEYNVIVKTRYCLFFHSTQNATIYTGPGQPHKVHDVHTRTGVVNATVILEEAQSMPRVVDAYNLTYCSSSKCMSKRAARNGAGDVSTEMEIVLDGLSPLTKYNLSVVPVIDFEGENYRGPSFVTEFTSNDIDLPVPTNITVAFSEDETYPLIAELSWEMNKTFIPDLKLAHYNVSIFTQRRNKFIASKIVNDSEVTFNELPGQSSLVANILPVFNYSNEMIKRKAAKFNFFTPREPIHPPRNFTFIGLNLTAVFCKWSPPEHTLLDGFVYNVTVSQNDANLYSVNASSSAQITLGELEKNTTYGVAIFVYGSDPSDNNTLHDTFDTLAEDYSDPTNLTMEPTKNGSEAVSYKLSWASSPKPIKASSYEIQSCKSSEECVVNKTTNTNIELPFAYFADYAINVAAIYMPGLNQTTRRSINSTLATPGTTPGLVTGVNATNVSSENATLTWNAPANVPKNVSRMYQLSDDANNFNAEVLEEKLTIEKKLSPYRHYNVSIRATVTYKKENFTGDDAYFQFTSDAAAPGPVKEVEVKQKPHSNILIANWTAPEAPNGPLDFYEVSTYDSDDKLISTITVVGSLGTQIVLPNAHSSAKYNVSVRAVNYDHNNKTMPGLAKTADLNFIGIDAPEAGVVSRTGHTLTLKAKPANKTIDPGSVFFVATNWNGTKFADQKGVIEVGELRPYTNETVQVAACYSESFCSETFPVTHLTNVAGPSAVNNLVPRVINVTIPSFAWEVPTDLNGPLDGYLVFFKDLTNSSVHKFALLPADQTWYRSATEDEYETYSIDVTAFNYDLDVNTTTVKGDSSSSNVTTSGYQAPKPQNFHQANATTDSIIVEWEVPEFKDWNITWFHIELPTQKLDEFTQNTSYSLDKLKPYQEVPILAKSCVTKNISDCGLARTFTALTEVDTPANVTNITTTNIYEASAELTWSKPQPANGPIDGYIIAVSPSDAKNHTWHFLPGNQLKYNATKLDSGAKYMVQIMAYNTRNGERLDSKVQPFNFTTVAHGSFPVWLVVFFLVVLAGAVVAGVFIFRRRRSAPDDTEHLIN
jgi:hypothetical protein